MKNFRQILDLMEMSRVDALNVFNNLGVNANELDNDTLKKEYRKLIMSHHPDRGGDAEIAKDITAAYDVLKNGSGASKASAGSRAYGAPRDPNDFSHLDNIKAFFAKAMAGKSAPLWTVMNFDGHFFRNSFTVPGDSAHFHDMARLIQQWDRHYDCRAIFVGTKKMLELGAMALIWSDGEFHQPYVTMRFDSPNLNPANDQYFTRQLPEILDQIKAGDYSDSAIIQ